MVSYKLIYFPVRGRAELARLMFAYSGQAYINETITGADWQAKKDCELYSFNQVYTSPKVLTNPVLI